MRKSSFISAAVLAALVALAAIAPGVAAAKSVSFSGTYKGTFSATKNGSTVTISSVKGTGTGTLGLNKLSGKGSGKTTSESCGNFGGPGVISGSGGSVKLSVVSAKSIACAASGDNLTFKGSAKVSGGSGKYGKASGTLTFKGTCNKKSGAFSVKITGTLSL